jgi:hypothetical protein
MNESHPHKSNPITWSARDRWVFRVVGALLGLIWGLLGVVLQEILLSSRTFELAPSAENPVLITIVFGMVFGVAHTSQFWLQAHRRVRFWLLEVLMFAAICVGFGILWGWLLVLVVWPFMPSLGFALGLPVQMLLWIPVFGGFMGLYTVVPAAILMAPVTVLVWQRILKRLRSQYTSRQA